MILIIEGMDRCGKSTLVQNLRKNYFKSPRTFVHHSSSPPNVDDKNRWEVDHYSSLLSTAIDMSENKGYDIIFDRFHLGAIVYGTRFRGADPSGIYELDDLYLKTYQKSATVLLTDFAEAIAARDDGESLEVSREEFEETRHMFIESFQKSNCPNKLHINISENGGFKSTYQSVVDFLDGVKNDRH